jgi:hypothetical protein
MAAVPDEDLEKVFWGKIYELCEVLLVPGYQFCSNH